MRTPVIDMNIEITLRNMEVGQTVERNEILKPNYRRVIRSLLLYSTNSPVIQIEPLDNHKILIKRTK